jgi:ceramide glucosyltransferase
VAKVAAVIALALYAAILMLKTLLACWYVRRYPPPDGRAWGDVSVCQPILSGDPDLEPALESNLQALPLARFLWLIDDTDATAARIAAAVKERHPGRDIAVLVSGTPPDGVNPKLFKLERARQAVGQGLLLVLDDDTRVQAPSVAALQQALGRAELATGLPFYRDSARLPGRLLGQFVNNNSALTYLPLLPLTPPVSINGMCYALDAARLEQLGGFAPLLRHLTDDLAVAERVRSAGGRIIQTPFPQEVSTTLDSLSGYFVQMHRWYVFALLLLRRQSARMALAIGVLCGLPPVLLACALVSLCVHPSPLRWAALAGVLGLRAAILCGLQWRLSGKVRHRPVISLASELLQPLHLLHALAVKSIRWRTRRYRVYDNDRFVSL